MPDYRGWLAKGLEKDGVDVATVAAALEKHHSVVYKLIDGTRKFHVDELPKIASAIGEPVPMDGEAIMPSRSFIYRKHVILNNCGIVTAGSFSAPKRAAADDLTIVFRDEQFPKVQHMAFGVAGKQLESHKIFDGDRVFCLDYEGMGGFQSIREGTPVVCERTRKGKRELAIKIAVFSDKPRATEPEIGIDVMRSLRSANGKSTTDAIRVLAVVRSCCRTFA